MGWGGGGKQFVKVNGATVSKCIQSIGVNTLIHKVTYEQAGGF